jgi:hypothetical protein
MADAIHSVPTFQWWGYLKFNGYSMIVGTSPQNSQNPHKFLIAILPECRDAMYSVRSNTEWQNTNPKLKSMSFRHQKGPDILSLKIVTSAADADYNINFARLLRSGAHKGS